MIRLLPGDCREVLATLPDASVHCCITSPPYYGLRDYGVAGQLGLEATPDEYLATMVAVFREVRRVLRNDGTCWVNMGDSYNAGTSAKRKAPQTVVDVGGWQDAEIDGGARIGVAGLAPKQLLMMPARLALALQADGWWLRSDIIWAKPNPMPESCRDRPTSAHEHVFLLTKRARYFFDADAVREETNWAAKMPDGWDTGPGAHGSVHRNGREAGANHGASGNGRNLRNVWTIATHAYSAAHFATYPPELVERCIKAGTSERGACSQCGAPWVRVTEAGEVTARGGKGLRYHEARETGLHPWSYKPGTDDDVMTARARVTTGWAASCQCDAPTVPCTVLDPFAGAGTTLLVADRLQRDAIGIELNAAYTEMAMQRCRDDAPLFAATEPPSDDVYDRDMRDLFEEAAD